MTPPQTPPFDPVSEWNQQFGSQLPPDMPDTAYDSMRNQYFQTRVMPHVLKGGYDPSESWDKFKSATEREHASGPGLAAQTAVDSFLAPFKDIAPYAAEKAHISQEQKELEVRRAGGAAGAWKIAGEIAGQAPFWTVGMEGAGAGIKALEAGPLLGKAIKIAAGGLIQGSYDAAKAPEGRGLIEGMQGAAWGAGMTAGFESVGPLWRFLKDGGMEEDAAKHVEGVAQGTEPVTDQTVDAALKTPRLDMQIGDWMTQQIKAIKQSGVPLKAQPGADNGLISIQMTGADGKPYSLGGTNGAGLSDIGNIITRISDHLDAGGSIDKVSGDGKTVAQFYNLLAGSKPETFDISSGLRSDLPDPQQVRMPNDEVMPDTTEEREHELYGYRGAAVEATNLGMAQSDYMAMMRSSGMKFVDTPGIGRNLNMKSRAAINVNELINSKNNMYHATDLEGMKGILESGRIDIPDRDELMGHMNDIGEALREQHPDWDDIQIADEAEKQSFGQAGVSVSRTPRLASKADKAITFVIDAEKMPATRPYVEEGFGKESYIDRQGIEAMGFSPETEAQLLSQVDPSGRNPHFEFEQRTYNEPVPLSAVKGIIVDKEALQEAATTDIPLRPGEDFVPAAARHIKNLADQHNIPIRFVENGAELHGYRAGMSKLPEGQRFQIPLYDQLEELHTGQVLNKVTGEVFNTVNDALYGKSMQEHDMSPERVRGDGIRLNDMGKREVDTLGQQFARKGGLDEIVATNVPRGLETAGALVKHSPNAQISDVTEATRSWGNGDLTGAENTPDVRSWKDDLAANHPDTPIGGRDPDSGRPGESFNQVTGRVLPYIKSVMDAWMDRPPEARGKIGIVTHFTPIKVIEGWLAKGMPDDFSVDIPSYLRERSSVGGVYKLSPDAKGKWSLRMVNMANDQPLEDAIYLIRHGETDWNKGGMPTAGAEPGEEPSLEPYRGRYKETPIMHRFVGREVPGISPEMVQKYPYDPMGMTMGDVGQKASVFYRNPDRETMFHETFHALMSNLSLMHWFDAKSGDSFVRNIYDNWFTDESKAIYKDRFTAEEVMAYVSSALRTNNWEKLNEFVEADTDLETTLNFVANSAKDLRMEALARNRDSIPLRTFMRKMDSVMARSTSNLEDLKRMYSPTNMEPNIENGMYTLKDGNSKTFYLDRQSLVDDMESEWMEPLQAPNLVDGVPVNTPRYAASLPAPNPNRPPISTEPPPPDISAGSRPPIRAGSYLFSRLFRPFYDWLGDWTSKFDRQDIYNAFDKIKDARTEYDNAMRPSGQFLSGLADKIKPERWTDWHKWVQADDANKAFVERELQFKPEEVEDIKSWQEIDKGLDLGITDFIQKDVPRLEAAGWDTEKVFPRGKDTSFWGKMVQSERVDPKDTNLLRLSATALRTKMFDTFMDPVLDDAEKMIKDNKSELGQLYPLLNRHIAAIRGIPDYTQQMAHGVIQTATEMINSGIERFNGMLPESMQLPKIEAPPGEILQDYLTFSYAGMLGMRPGIWVRDASQFFVTSFPLLGNYAWKGMGKAMEATKEGAASDAFKEAQRYGVFIEKNAINQMITAGDEASGGGALGKLERWSQAALGAQRWAHNSNRLVSFWGHAQKVLDATEQFGKEGDLEDWIKNSDAWFMNSGMRNRYVKELQNLTGTGYDDFSKRMAKSLTELTQWNYNREASPGIYDYAIGRLFGQYGTWPLNYIEYARRFAMGADKGAAAQALARLVIAHGSILAAGHAAGIDTSDWVFTQPMAYGGGPLMEAVTSVPEAVGDWSSPRGSEARRNVLEVVSPLNMIPGIEELRAIHEAVTSHDPNLYVRMLGFQPLEETSKHHGWHQVSP